MTIDLVLLGLTHLPTLLPSSPLKSLNAANCSLNTIHESFFRVGIGLKLSNNNIRELPRKEALEYLKVGEGFKELKVLTANVVEGFGIDLGYNPLIYPPKNVYEAGNAKIRAYLTRYDNALINPKDITVHMIGDEEKGKTSFARAISGQINTASEINYRTQAFDIYTTHVKDIKANILDLGGQKQYEASIPVTCNENGLKMNVLNPDDLEDESKLDKAAGTWVDKILDGAVSPHFQFVVTKTDTIQEDVKEATLSSGKENLVNYLESKLAKLKQVREDRLTKLQNDISEIDEDLGECAGNPERSKVLQERKQVIQKQIEHQIYRVNHLPNFNTDCISFVSSVTREGFDSFEKNFSTVISKLPPIMLQDHWQNAAKWLLTKNDDKPYVTFGELQKWAFSPDAIKESDKSDESDTTDQKNKREEMEDSVVSKTVVDETDLIDLLTALSTMGRIIWDKADGQRETIFHRIDRVSHIMKSIFHHRMEEILQRYATLKGIDPAMLAKQYKQGQVPAELIESMFVHIEIHEAEHPDQTQVDFKSMEIRTCDENQKNALNAFISRLMQLQILIPLEEKVMNEQMYFIPHLIFTSEEVLCDPHPVLKIHLQLAFEIEIYKKTFCMCSVAALSVMQALVSVTQADTSLKASNKVTIIKVGHFEVTLNNSGRTLDLVIQLLDHDVRHDVVWILLNDISSKFGLEWKAVDCSLLCPKSEDPKPKLTYNPIPTSHREVLEDRHKEIPRQRKRCPCDEKCRFPSSFTQDIILQLNPRNGQCLSPLVNPHAPPEDLLETENLIAVLATKPIPDKDISTLKEQLPVFCRYNYERFSRNLRPVRQKIDDVSKCDHEKPCNCYLFSPAYLKIMWLLEENSLMVTNGDWPKFLKEINARYPEIQQDLCGLPFSMAPMVRVIRNMVAHEKAESISDAVWTEIRQSFQWLIMRCFSVRVLASLPQEQEPTLWEFALAFRDKENRVYNERLHSDDLEHPPQPLFRVVVSRFDRKMESMFYLEKPNDEDEVKQLKTQICQTFQLPTTFQEKIFYKGVYQSVSETADHLDMDEWKLPHDISLLDLLDLLDTRRGHLIHVVEESRTIQVVIITASTGIEQSFLNNKTFQAVLTLAQVKMGKVNLQLFYQKKQVHKEDVVGSVCEEDICEIYAFNSADEVSKRAYFRDGRSESESEGEDEDPDDIMEGLSLFD